MEVFHEYFAGTVREYLKYSWNTREIPAHGTGGYDCNIWPFWKGLKKKSKMTIFLKGFLKKTNKIDQKLEYDGTHVGKWAPAISLNRFSHIFHIISILYPIYAMTYLPLKYTLI